MVAALNLTATATRVLGAHTGFEWTMVSDLASRDFVIAAWPRPQPDRVVTVTVHPGAEVFEWSFAGHNADDFAYDDEVREEVLVDLIDLAVAAATGPTTVTIRRRGGRISSTQIDCVRIDEVQHLKTTNYVLFSVRSWLDRRGTTETKRFVAL